MAGASSFSLFTDIQSPSNELRARHREVVRDILGRIGEVGCLPTGNGLSATLSAPNRALMCAVQIQRSFEDWGRPGDAPVRIGLGTTSDEAERATSRARGGEILVTEAVRELAEPRGYLFTARGALERDGVAVPLFAVRWWEHD